MKKNLLISGKIYISFLLLSAIIYSCCPEETFEIKSFDSLSVYQVNQKTSSSSQEDSITDEFQLRAEFGTYLSVASDFNLTTSAYATSCDNTIFLNELDKESIRVSLDKDFIFDGQTIAANTNLTDFVEIKNNIDIFYEIVNVHFLNDFLDKAQFEPGIK